MPGQFLCTDHQLAAQAAEMIKALAHPIRLRIIALLVSRESEHVNGLAESLGAKQAIISQQLRILRNNGLVQVARENGFAHYRIARPGLRDLVRCIEGCPA